MTELAAVQEEQRAQTRAWAGRTGRPDLLRDHVRGLHHRRLPQAASERHQVRRRRAGRRRPRQLRAGLQKAAGSGFDISQVEAPAEAAHAVRQRDLDAAFVPTANPKQPATIIVAGAGGRIVATAAETLARSATTAQGTQLAVREVRPLADGDEIGLGIFLFLIVCTICGYITPTILETLAPGLCPAAAIR